jgi:hypothetical protein
MIGKFTPELLESSGIKSAVNAYLMARADSIRERVVAEDFCTDVEEVLVECAVNGLNLDVGGPQEFFENLIIVGKLREFIDIVCAMVVQSPGYKNPLTGKEA